MPEDYYRQGQGGRDLIWAFASYEANQKAERGPSKKVKVIPSRAKSPPKK